MRCSSCGVALPVFGLLSAVAVFAAQTTTTTGSDLTPAGGMVVASTRGEVKDTCCEFGQSRSSCRREYERLAGNGHSPRLDSPSLRVGRPRRRCSDARRVA